VEDFCVLTIRVGCFVPLGPVPVVAGVLLILHGCGVVSLVYCFVLFVCFSFLQQEMSSGFVGFGTVCSLSP